MHIHPSILPVDFQEPPDCNTGAANTQSKPPKPQEPRRVLIDDYAATFPAGPLKPLIEALGWSLSEVVFMDYGRYGYRQSAQIGHTVILFDGTPAMGISIQMQGKAMAEELARRGPAGLLEFMRTVRDLGGKETRCDVALDVFDVGDVDVQRVREELPNARRGSSKRKYIEEFDDNNGGKRTGATQYIGSTSSHCFLRVYDKAEEQGVDYPWVRWEVQARDAIARQIVDWLLDYEMELGTVVHGLLKGLVTFTEPSESDSNKARWPVAAWWEEFLGDVKKLKLPPLEVIRKTLDEVVQTLERQYGAILGAVSQAAPTSEWFDAWMKSVVERGVVRFKQKHRDLVHETRRIRSYRESLWEDAWGPDYGMLVSAGA